MIMSFSQMRKTRYREFKETVTKLMNGRAWTQIQVSDFKPHILILDLPDKEPRIIGKRMLCAFPHMPSPL